MTTRPKQTGPPAFVTDGTNGFTFDTGILRGRLRADGRSRGLTSVIHVPTGAAVDRSHGLLNHYRVFTTATRYGRGLRDQPSEAQLQADGSVEARWPASREQPFELRAIYRWIGPATLEVETVVAAKADLPKFEVFLASYFQTGFTNSLVCAADGAGDVPAGFVAADQALGEWLMFPRDPAAVLMIQDGRWALPPNPINWVVRPPFLHPIGVRRDPGSGLTVLLMSPPTDCFAVSTPYETEGHYSTYLSLFGRDLQKGETARARARMLVGVRLSDAETIRAYEAGLPERE